MKVLAVSLLLALAMIFAGCGASEEQVADTESEVAEEEVAEVEEVEVVEDIVVVGQLPEPWPGDILMPEGMIVAMVAANQDGYPLVETQYAEGTEPIALIDVFEHYCNMTTNPDWTAPLLEQNSSEMTPDRFHLDLMHPEYNLIQIDGYIDESGILTVEFIWLS